MTPLVKLILVLLGLAYLISPGDVIPELYLPWVGWIDDSLVMLCLYHLIRYGRLPAFLFKTGRKHASGEKPRETDTNRPSSHAAPGRPSHRTGTTGRTAQGTTAANAGSFKSPYAVLGVNESASWSDIQTAYKNKVKQYHPDKLSHLGEEFSHLANEKFLEIQQAYAALKSIYNGGK